MERGGMRGAGDVWAGTGQHAHLAEPCASSLPSTLSSCYILFLNISCVTSLYTWGAGQRSQCQIHRSGCQHLCPCACMCFHVWACFSLDYMLILAPGQTCKGKQQPPLLGWNRIFYYSELILYHQQTIHFLFQMMNEHAEHQRFQHSSLGDFTDNLLHYKKYLKFVSVFSETSVKPSQACFFKVQCFVSTHHSMPHWNGWLETACG